VQVIANKQDNACGWLRIGQFCTPARFAPRPSLHRRIFYTIAIRVVASVVELGMRHHRHLN
jgi:hypothetical protein